ncbi:MAG: ABC transporter permease [Candidatus Thorarchaeota archaeon SMTZ1-83]|nr:MAG: hypothetical protein AM324_11485 [Candidatus Thorarchaeota archaeon SMTZ1-83]
MLSFLLILSMITGVIVYIDSYSLRSWYELTDIGPHAMIAHGEGIQNYVDEIEGLEHVTKASATEDATAFLRMDQNEVYQGGGLAPDFMMTGRSYSLSNDYISDFPSVFNLLEGRFPETELEIAISLSVANSANVWIGAQMNYSHFLNGPKRPVFVVGVYLQDVGRKSIDYYYDSIGVVLPSLLNPEQIEYRVYLDVERDLVTPLDPAGSLSRLDQVEESIFRLYPGYPEELRYSEFYVSSYLADGIEDYVTWLNEQRLHQLAREQVLLLLAMMLSLLTVRYNFREREQEVRFLLSRGASSFYANRRVYVEIIGLSLVVVPLSLWLGVFSSRIGLASVGFLELEALSLTTGPPLISFDAVFISVIAGFAIPSVGIIAYHGLKPKEEKVEEGPGRLAKLTRGVRLVRWDLAIVMISFLFMAALYLGGSQLRENPFLITVQVFLPIPVFIGIASLVSKTMTRLANPLSGAFSRFLGKASASIGARKLSRNTSMSGPYALTLALVSVLVINSVAVSGTMAQTQLNHARFAVGADVTFRLSRSMVTEWSGFAEDVDVHWMVENGTFVAEGILRLSEGSQSSVVYIAVSPSEYMKVGYDHTGERLEQSYIGQLLVELATSPTGALISEDIAQEYELGVGDTLRAFSLGTDGDSAEFNVVGILPAVPAPMIPIAGSSSSLGSRRVLLNLDYMATKVDLVESATYYYCVRTVENADGTVMVQDLSETWGADQIAHAIITAYSWAGIDQIMDEYFKQPAYHMDRAIDSILVVLSVAPVIGATLVYESHLARTRRREIALLKSMGAKWKDLLATHFVEMAAIAILGIMVLLLFGPVFVANSLELSILEYRLWSYSFPVLVHLSISWTLSITIVAVILSVAVFGSILLFSLVQSFRLKDGLEARWTETSLLEVAG